MTKKLGYDEYQCNQCGNKYYSNKEQKYSSAIQVSSKKEFIDIPYEIIYEFDIDTPGYGSVMDTFDIESFHLCEKCLLNIMKSFKIKPEILDEYDEDISKNILGDDNN